jgi:hypothetical protein
VVVAGRAGEEAGIDVTADELKELQYEVVLTDRVTQWLVTP